MTKRAVLIGADWASLSAAENIRRALKNVSEIRTTEVERARRLVASVQYPPTELIDGIARLLARDRIVSK